jgi:hypothetical protein
MEANGRFGLRASSERISSVSFFYWPAISCEGRLTRTEFSQKNDAVFSALGYRGRALIEGYGGRRLVCASRRRLLARRRPNPRRQLHRTDSGRRRAHPARRGVEPGLCLRLFHRAPDGRRRDQRDSRLPPSDRLLRSSRAPRRGPRDAHAPIAPDVMPNVSHWRNPEHRELYLSGLRLAMDQTE